MFLSDSGVSRYDWNFRLLGHNVRVHPFFWLTTLLLGLRDDPFSMLVWVAAVFVSVLIHEMGHIWAMRRYGENGDILLYSFGGLAISRGGSWRTPNQQIVISAMGPIAGFVLAAGVGLLVSLAGGHVLYTPVWRFVPSWTALILPSNRLDLSGLQRAGFIYSNEFINDVLWCSVFWGLMNLLPIIPLDGGRISESWLQSRWGAAGRQRAFQISMVLAGIMALVGLFQRSLFLALLYGSLAFSSYQALQQTRPSWRNR